MSDSIMIGNSLDQKNILNIKHSKIYLLALVAFITSSRKKKNLDLQPVSSASSGNFIKQPLILIMFLAEINSDKTYPVASGSVTV